MTEFFEWVDGKSFAAWLEGKRPDLRDVLSESQQRTLYRFRAENGRGSLDVVDEMCCLLSLHINEIPEWIWTTPPKRARLKPIHDPEIRKKAVRMLNSGTSMREVSETLGIPFGTIRTWKKRANA